MGVGGQQKLRFAMVAFFSRFTFFALSIFSALITVLLVNSIKMKLLNPSFDDFLVMRQHEVLEGDVELVRHVRSVRKQS